MIKDNIFKIKERIAQACSKVKRNPQEITIVAVAKGRTPDEIKEILESGITDIGENRVQEASSKYRELANRRTCELANQRAYELTNLRTIRWHMVGHLQTNKVKDALKLFGLIHSVDSLHLAREIDKQASRINKVQDILIEVKTSEEATKFGLRPDEVFSVIKEMFGFKNINIKGLMTIAPLLDNPEEARSYFKALRELKDKINQLTNHQLTILSMGMTDDFEVAIEEGSNMLRLGRAIFEC
jgi:hypothetical protein